jgi:hypothetical protein
VLKEYIAYLKDNPQGYWFKSKLYGWGWTPARWQGWLVVVVYVGGVVLLHRTLDYGSPSHEISGAFLLGVMLFTAALIGICYKTGEPPRWQWGQKGRN